jgi:hypothetical protein
MLQASNSAVRITAKLYCAQQMAIKRHLIKKMRDNCLSLFCISVFFREVALYIKILIKLHFLCPSILKKRERQRRQNIALLAVTSFRAD